MSKKDFDSIANSRKMKPRKQTFYRDTITNNFIIVNREFTELEKKEQQIAIENKLNNEKELRKKMDGNILEDLGLTDISGKKHNLNSLEGKVIVLNFWYIQCKPCLAEFPELNDLKANFKSKPVVFFAVTFNDKKSLDIFFKNHKLDFNVIPNGRPIIDKFKVPHYPCHILIDQGRNIEYIKNIKRLNSKINKSLQSKKV